MDKLIITAAVVGAETTRRDHPKLPLAPQEIATAALEAGKAGAAVIHLHVRDRKGNPTQDREVFREVIKLIKAEADLIIQVSTGGAVGMTPEERVQPVSLKPEMATLTTGSINFGGDVFLNRPSDIEAFAKAMQEHGVKPEIEVFDTGMIENALALVRKGLLKPPLHFDLVMGVPGGITATPKNLLHLVECLPIGSIWSVAGVGRQQLQLGVMAVILGGHVRVGFEDNVYYSKGSLAESNAQLVERIARVAGELGRNIAAPAEARKILGISAAASPSQKSPQR